MLDRARTAVPIALALALVAGATVAGATEGSRDDEPAPRTLRREAARAARAAELLDALAAIADRARLQSDSLVYGHGDAEVTVAVDDLVATTRGLPALLAPATFHGIGDGRHAAVLDGVVASLEIAAADLDRRVRNLTEIRDLWPRGRRKRLLVMPESTAATLTPTKPPAELPGRIEAARSTLLRAIDRLRHAVADVRSGDEAAAASAAADTIDVALQAFADRHAPGRRAVGADGGRVFVADLHDLVTLAEEGQRYGLREPDPSRLRAVIEMVDAHVEARVEDQPADVVARQVLGRALRELRGLATRLRAVSSDPPPEPHRVPVVSSRKLPDDVPGLIDTIGRAIRLARETGEPASTMEPALGRLDALQRRGVPFGDADRRRLDGVHDRLRRLAVRLDTDRIHAAGDPVALAAIDARLGRVASASERLGGIRRRTAVPSTGTPVAGEVMDLRELNAVLLAAAEGDTGAHGRLVALGRRELRSAMLDSGLHPDAVGAVLDSLFGAAVEAEPGDAGSDRRPPPSAARVRHVAGVFRSAVARLPASVTGESSERVDVVLRLVNRKLRDVLRWTTHGAVLPADLVDLLTTALGELERAAFEHPAVRAPEAAALADVAARSRLARETLALLGSPTGDVLLDAIRRVRANVHVRLTGVAVSPVLASVERLVALVEQAPPSAAASAELARAVEEAAALAALQGPGRVHRRERLGQLVERLRELLEGAPIPPDAAPGDGGGEGGAPPAGPREAPAPPSTSPTPPDTGTPRADLGGTASSATPSPSAPPDTVVPAVPVPSPPPGGGHGGQPAPAPVVVAPLLLPPVVAPLVAVPPSPTVPGVAPWGGGLPGPVVPGPAVPPGVGPATPASPVPASTVPVTYPAAPGSPFPTAAGAPPAAWPGWALSSPWAWAPPALVVGSPPPAPR